MHRIALVPLVTLGTLGTSFGGTTVCLAQDVARMDQIVQSYVTNKTFAGSVLVARGGDVIVSKGYGLANVEWNVPSSPSARFKVASITDINVVVEFVRDGAGNVTEVVMMQGTRQERATRVK